MVSFNLDYPVLIFTVLMLANFFEKRIVWYVVSCLLLVFSKETGILIYLAFLGGRIVLLLMRSEKSFSKMLWLDTIPIVFLAGYVFYTHGNFWTSQGVAGGGKGAFVWGNNCQFCFGLNWQYVKTRLFQMLVMNFGWCLSVIVFLGVLLKTSRNWLVALMWWMWIIFVAFNLIFVAMSFSRYVVPSVFFLTFIAYYYTNQLIKNSRLKITIMGLMIIAMTIQVYKSIDPVTNKMLGGGRMGKNNLPGVFCCNDGLVYNGQFVCVDKLSREIKKNLKSDTVLLSDQGVGYFFEDLSITEIGNNFDGIKGKNFMYLNVPWFAIDEIQLSKLERFFRVSDKMLIDEGGYQVYLYSLEKINVGNN